MATAAPGEEPEASLLKQHESAPGEASLPMHPFNDYKHTQLGDLQDKGRMLQIEMFMTRIDSIANFSIISTLMFAASLAELSGFDSSNFRAETCWADAYLLIMLAVTGVGLYCAMLSVLTVAACQRVKSWDDKRARAITIEKAQRQEANHLVPKALAVAQEGKHVRSGPLTLLVLMGMVDDMKAPLSKGMLLFPASCFLLVVAVTMRVLQHADPLLQIVGPIVVALTGAETLRHSYRLVWILVH